MTTTSNQLSIPLAQELSQSSSDSLAVWVHISEGGVGGLIDKACLMNILNFSPDRLHEALISLYDFGVVDVNDFIYNHELSLASIH